MTTRSEVKSSCATRQDHQDFSGGQQARLLLPLPFKIRHTLLDEPTNNPIRQARPSHAILVEYKKLVSLFPMMLNFERVYRGRALPDVFTRDRTICGKLFDVVKQISARIEKENRKMHCLQGDPGNKDKANFFANKGGNMRSQTHSEKAADMKKKSGGEKRRQNHSSIHHSSQPELVERSSPYRR